MNARILGVCGLAALAAAGAPLAGGLAGAREAPVRVATVDMEELIRLHPATERAFEEAQRKRRADVETLRQKEAERRTLEESQDLYARNSKEWLELRKEIRILEATRELDRKVITAEYQLSLRRAMDDVYGKVSAAVKEVAGKEGVDVVLNASGRPIGGSSHISFLDRLARRDVAYADPALDLTEAVLRHMGVDPEKKPGGSGGGDDGDSGGGKKQDDGEDGG